jgi:hypothetical protein
VSLGRYGVTGVERAVGDNAGSEAGYGSARADSDATRNLAGAGICNRGGAQDGEVLGRSEGLRVSLSGKSPQRGEDEEESSDGPKTK